MRRKKRYGGYRSIERRLWGDAKRRGSCLIWRPEGDPTVYGNIKFEGKIYPASRLAYILTHGPIADDHVVMHSCDTPRCIEPSHLSDGTHTDNLLDALSKGRRLVGDQHPSRTKPWTRPRGEAHGRAILTASQVEDIRRRLAAKEQGKVIAAEYGVSPSTISLIATGKNWRPGPPEQVDHSGTTLVNT